MQCDTIHAKFETCRNYSVWYMDLCMYWRAMKTSFGIVLSSNEFIIPVVSGELGKGVE